MSRRPFAVALFALIAALPTTPGAPARADAGRYRVELELSARQSGARGRAEVVAGARLEMRAVRDESGRLELLFERAIEAPWKLFHVDPTGPFGRQTKVATVITLPQASWPALDERRAEHARLAAERHARWRPAGRRKPPLDGFFSFIVIGPPRDRFNVTVGSDGGVLRVDNRMTDRWLGGDFGRFVGTWGSGADDDDEEAPHGYWFWNHGETEPFEWEPGTYRALAAALELLGATPEDGRELFAGAEAVLAGLAPALGARGRMRTGPLPIKGESRPGLEGETVTESLAKNSEAALRRRQIRSGTGVVSDELELELERPRQDFRLKVAYGPAPVDSAGREDPGRSGG